MRKDALVDEPDAIAGRLAAALVARGQTVAIAESAAGGLISAALLGVPGASAYFIGAAVVYTAASREALLDVPRATVAAARAAGEPTSMLMARTVRARMAADWAIGETGAAGPTGNRYGNPAGWCSLSVSGPVERSLEVETGAADRRTNMAAFAAAALHLLEQALAEAGKAGLCPDPQRAGRPFDPLTR